MSKIEWTGRTWNPTTGCDRISPGCDGCYALKLAARLKAMGQEKYQRDGDPNTSGPGFGLTLHPGTLGEPADRRVPTTWFVDSMSDLFHKDVPDDYIAQVFAGMSTAPQHTFQVLTKRSKRMQALLSTREFVERVDDHRGGAAGDFEWPLPNLWLGVSVELPTYLFRLDHLAATPARIRFGSFEPLLGGLDLSGRLVRVEPCPRCSGTMSIPADGGGRACPDCYDDPHGQGKQTTRLLDWAIVGGESGRGRDSRPMHPQWARDIRDQCTEAGVAFFFKQWGDWAPVGTWTGAIHRLTIDGRLFEPGARLGMDHMMRPVQVHRFGKKRAGRELDGRTWDEMPVTAASAA